MNSQPVWNFEQHLSAEPGDETSVNLRAYLDRMPDEKLLAYQSDWSAEQVQQWCGDFRDDGLMFLICSERAVDIVEFRSQVEACLRYRAGVRK